jgi:hypothetical protein
MVANYVVVLTTISKNKIIPPIHLFDQCQIPAEILIIILKYRNTLLEGTKVITGHQIDLKAFITMSEMDGLLQLTLALFNSIKDFIKFKTLCHSTDPGETHLPI